MGTQDSIGSPQLHMVLRYDLLTMHLTIDGDALQPHQALAILGQAVREYEAQERQARALMFKTQLEEQVNNQRIADMVRRR